MLTSREFDAVLTRYDQRVLVGFVAIFFAMLAAFWVGGRLGVLLQPWAEAQLGRDEWKITILPAFAPAFGSLAGGLVLMVWWAGRTPRCCCPHCGDLLAESNARYFVRVTRNCCACGRRVLTDRNPDEPRDVLLDDGATSDLGKITNP
ncbi:MAG TPA: hypothetical protein VMZ71_01835, partial [Gemmataceae bacterium]|nr:hypothetical protein [Gemmataceae bacterium]